MPSNIDFGQPFDPLPGIQRGNEFANRMFQYAARQQAGQLYGIGDVEGAARALAGAGDIEGAQGIEDAQRRRTFQDEDRAIAAKDRETVAADRIRKQKFEDEDRVIAGEDRTRKRNFEDQDQNIQNIDAQHKFLTQQAPLLKAIYDKEGAAGLQHAWAQVKQELQRLGVGAGTLAQLDQGFAANPEGTLQALGGVADATWQDFGGYKALVTPDGRELKRVDKTAAPTAGGTSGADWQWFQDEDGTPYRGNRVSGVFIGPDGKPGYIPKSIQRIGTTRQGSKPLTTKAINDLSETGNRLDSLSRLSEGFKDEYGGKTWMGESANTVGRIFGDTTGQTQWWQDYQNEKNEVRKRLFGTALTSAERAEFDKAQIDPRMDSAQIRKNLERQNFIAQQAARKLANAYAASGYSKEAIEGALGMSVDELRTIPRVPPAYDGGSAAPSAPPPSRGAPMATLPGGWTVKVKP